MEKTVEEKYIEKVLGEPLRAYREAVGSLEDELEKTEEVVREAEALLKELKETRKKI